MIVRIILSTTLVLCITKSHRLVRVTMVWCRVILTLITVISIVPSPFLIRSLITVDVIRVRPLVSTSIVWCMTRFVIVFILAFLFWSIAISPRASLNSGVARVMYLTVWLFENGSSSSFRTVFTFKLHCSASAWHH